MAEYLYDQIGGGYVDYRRPDPRIAAAIEEALGDAASVINVGAGAGSYEPTARAILAIEPSAAMLRQRRPGSARSLRASANALPVRDRSFAAALAILTVHHWPDWRRGLAEMKRVARDRVVILTWDPRHAGFWLVQDYFPEILDVDRKIFPALDQMADVLGPTRSRVLPIPSDCSDGFLGAYWRRPERYLDAGARQAISTFSRVADPEPGLRRLRADLDSGSWADRNRALLDRRELDLGYRLVVAESGD